jgi:VanZ family protein
VLRREPTSAAAGDVQAAPLARTLFAVYVALITYASLYPLEGWQHLGLAPFDYLLAPWPRYVSLFDVTLNVLGYAPYGFLFVASVYPRFSGRGAPLTAVASAALLSIALEAAQSYLPSRFASNVDVLCNVAGAAIGALAGRRLAPWLLHHGPFRRLRAAAFRPGPGVDIGLVLLGLWLFTQLNTVTLLFGAGDLRELVLVPAGRARAPEFFVSIEAITATANLVVIALLLSALMAERRAVRPLFLGLVGSALVLKTAAFALITRIESFAWLTPGAQEGLIAGVLVALVAVSLPRTAGLALAAVLTMAATVLVNLAPPNPYFTSMVRLWHQGQFLNINGVTRVVSGLWPFLALGYLIYLASRRGGDEK